MLSLDFKKQVEEHLSHLRDSSPLLLGAQSGELTRQQFLDYLNNLMYFFKHTVIQLNIARTRALQLGCAELVEFLEEKIEEERGHDQWALNDLRNSGSLQEDVDLGRVTPATHRILAYSVDLINRDPELLLAYMFFHEYVTVLGGPQLLADLDAKCGISKDRITAISYHVKLDRHHVEEDLAEIERVLERSPEKAPAMRNVIDETAQLATAFYAEAVSLLH